MPRHSFDQGFIKKIAIFVKNYMAADEELGEVDTFLAHRALLGVCQSLTRLEIICHYADQYVTSVSTSTKPTSESKEEKKVEPTPSSSYITWLQMTYKTFSDWDGEKELSDLEKSHIKDFLMLIKHVNSDKNLPKLFAQIKNRYFKNCRHLEIVNEKRVLFQVTKEELSDRLDIITPVGHCIDIFSSNKERSHSIRLRRNNDHFDFFDSNLGWAEYKNASDVATVIFDAMFASTSPSLDLAFFIYHSNQDTPHSYPTESEILKNLSSNSRPKAITNLIRIAALYGCNDSLNFYLTLPLRGVSFDAQDIKGNTPIAYSVINGHIATLELLLKFGATPDLSDHEGNFPLHHAAKAGHTPITKLLVDHIPKIVPNSKILEALQRPNKKNQTPWDIASAYEHKLCATVIKNAIDTEIDTRQTRSRKKTEPSPFCFDISCFMTCFNLFSDKKPVTVVLELKEVVTSSRPSKTKTKQD